MAAVAGTDDVVPCQRAIQPPEFRPPLRTPSRLGCAVAPLRGRRRRRQVKEFVVIPQSIPGTCSSCAAIKVSIMEKNLSLIL